MNSIDHVLEITRRNSDRVFLIDTLSGKRWTFAEMYERATAAAARLRREGYQKGDRIAFLLHNSGEFAAMYFACLYGGFVAVPINPALTREEVAYIVGNCAARVIFVSTDTANLVDDSSGMRRALLSSGGEPDAWNISALSSAPDFKPFDGITENDLMCIVYTSGTTARPSGVVHRISSMIQNANAFNQRLGIGPDNQFYGILAMTYLGGYYNLLMLPFAAGGSVVLSRAFDARSALNFWDTAIQNEVNTIWLVPTIISMLLSMDRGQKGTTYCREKVKLGLVGTAPLPVQVRKKFEEKYGVSLYENFGLSETFFITTNSPILPVLDGSVGRNIPDVQMTVLDEKGRALPYGEEGEIFVCTPFLMEGYYNAETKSANQLSNKDWFPTGDIGLISATGELFITGRKKDLIIRGGVNISPAAIETVLHSHPGVQECAVIGVPNAVNGEDVVAMVKLVAGADFEVIRGELAALSRERLGQIKQPSSILTIDEFPKSATGKIQKNKVRELARHKLGVGSLELHNRPVLPVAANSAMVPGRIRSEFPRTPQTIIDKLRAFPSGLVSDSMNRMGAMNSLIRSFVPGKSFCGNAFTVEEIEGGNTMSHLALEMIGVGDVLVISAKSSLTRSCWGSLQMLMASMRKVAAVVIDGTFRDLDEIQKLGVPIFALGVSPAGPMKGWGGNINAPVACGGVVVNPGDVVIGDDDGVVVVPRQLAEKVAACADERAKMEKSWFDQVRGGKATIDAASLRGKISAIEFIRDDSF